MYGYIRPFKPELRIREFELYNAAYCGLCRELGRNYGFLARFAVSFDCTLPALMASSSASVCQKRCPAKLGRKKPCLCGADGMKLTAAATLILARHKLLDNACDGGFFKKLGAKLMLAVSKRKFSRAALDWPEFAENTENCLAELAAIEVSKAFAPDILDRAADCFARVTAEFSLMAKDGADRRIWREIYYHIGRVVYILDAADDWAYDIRKGSFNPAVIRYSAALSPDENAKTALLPHETREKIRSTIEYSLAAAAAAFELLPSDRSGPIVGNIIYLGIPNVVTGVLEGTGKAKKARGKKHGSL